MPQPHTVNTDSIFISAIAFELAIGGAGLLLGQWIGPESREFVPQWNQYADIVQGIIWGTVAALPMIAVALIFTKLPIKSVRNLNHLSEEKLIPYFRQFSVAQLIVFAMAAGVCEELFFRGWLQCSLTGPINPELPWTPLVVFGVVLGGTIFGICHALTPLYFVLATLAGIFLGTLLVESSNLLVPVVAHFLYDIFMLIWLVRSDRTSG